MPYFLPAALLAMAFGSNTAEVLADARIQAWVQDFAPIVQLDSREISPLTSIDAQLALGATLTGGCADGSQRRLKVDRVDFLGRPEVQQLMRECPRELALDFGHHIAPAQNTAYYSVVSEGLYIKIQYWLFYGWNDATELGGGAVVAACGGHEGDWEHFSLRLNRERLEHAANAAELRAAVDDVYLAQHAAASHPESKWFRQAQLTFEGSHPVIYPGLGSHASYATPGDHPLMTIATQAIVDHNDGQGLRLPVAQGRLRAVVTEPWFGYAGRWGAVQHDGCDWLESVSSASNDGAYGPGHRGKEIALSAGDWYGLYRPQDGR